jgi:hypothetical protein
LSLALVLRRPETPCGVRGTTCVCFRNIGVRRRAGLGGTIVVGRAVTRRRGTAAVRGGERGASVGGGRRRASGYGLTKEVRTLLARTAVRFGLACLFASQVDTNLVRFATSFATAGFVNLAETLAHIVVAILAFGSPADEAAATFSRAFAKRLAAFADAANSVRWAAFEFSVRLLEATNFVFFAWFASQHGAGFTFGGVTICSIAANIVFFDASPVKAASFAQTIGFAAAVHTVVTRSRTPGPVRFATTFLAGRSETTFKVRATFFPIWAGGDAISFYALLATA